MDEKEKRAPEQKKDRRSSLKVSRRGFLKGMGAGALATTITSLPVPPVADAVALPVGLKEAVIQLNVNSRAYRLKVRSNWTLLEVLRRELGLTGTKKGCDRSGCGACTVNVDGKAIYACSILAIGMEGKKIVTIEGLADGGTLHPIQKSFSEHGGYQCGFCTSGQVMAAKALLERNPKPTEKEVRAALAGNLCRCGAYPKIIESVLGAGAKG